MSIGSGILELVLSALVQIIHPLFHYVEARQIISMLCKIPLWTVFHRLYPSMAQDLKSYVLGIQRCAPAPDPLPVFFQGSWDEHVDMFLEGEHL